MDSKAVIPIVFSLHCQASYMQTNAVTFIVKKKLSSFQLCSKVKALLRAYYKIQNSWDGGKGGDRNCFSANMCRMYLLCKTSLHCTNCCPLLSLHPKFHPKFLGIHITPCKTTWNPNYNTSSCGMCSWDRTDVGRRDRSR